MSTDLNRVTVIGRLGADPETKHLQNGSVVSNLRVAASEQWKDKNSGEKKEKVEWFRVTIWGALADIAQKYLRKGSRVFLEGKLQTRKWTAQDGSDRYSTEVVLQGFDAKLIFFDTKGGQTEARGDDADRDFGDEPDKPATGSGGAKTTTVGEDMSDDIPFAFPLYHQGLTP